MLPKLKEKLGGIGFEDVEEIKETVISALDTLTLKVYKGALQKWLESNKNCIVVGESYFEGD